MTQEKNNEHMFSERAAKVLLQVLLGGKKVKQLQAQFFLVETRPKTHMTKYKTIIHIAFSVWPKCHN
jgi:hypothetical protein